MKFKLPNITKEVADGKWHINFPQWAMSFSGKIVGWGLLPLGFYLILSQDTMPSPIATGLIGAYLSVQLINTAMNPPKYRIDPQ